MSVCSGYAILGCSSIAVAGFAATLSMVLDEAVVPLALSTVLIASSIPAFTSKNRVVVATVPLSLLIVIFGLSGYFNYALLAALGMIAISIYTMRVEAVASATSSIPIILALSGSEHFNLIASLAIAVIGVSLVRITRKLHSGIVLGASVIAFLGEPLIGVIVLASSLMALLASSDIISASGCPFRSDKYLILSGSIISVGGALLVFTFNWNSLTASLWLLGFLFLVSGTLVPVGSSYRRSA